LRLKIIKGEKMNYELFEKAAAVNGQFEVIPSKVSILAKGIIIDKNGYMQYKEKTYLTNMVKLEDLPMELQPLFLENKMQLQKTTQEIIEVEERKDNKFDSLNNILHEQLQNIVDPEDGTDISQELKKANAVCNIADKLISIADLSLKAEMFSHKKRTSNRSLYQG
jgi:flagellin-specific chaperone FliS